MPVVEEKDGGVATALAGYGQAGAQTDVQAIPGIPPEMLAAIKSIAADSVSQGIEEGVKRVVDKYHLEDVATWGKASVILEGVTAFAAVGIFLWLVTQSGKDKE